MDNGYQLKTSQLSKNRLHKLAKKLIEESNEDRKNALNSYAYFKQIVDEYRGNSTNEVGDTVNTAERCMVVCLELSQKSRDKTLKALELLIKIESKLGNKPTPIEEDADDLDFDDMSM